MCVFVHLNTHTVHKDKNKTKQHVQKVLWYMTSHKHYLLTSVQSTMQQKYCFSHPQHCRISAQNFHLFIFFFRANS